jgi:hypothetical protein
MDDGTMAQVAADPKRKLRWPTPKRLDGSAYDS